MSKDDKKRSEKQASDNFFSKNKALVQKKAEELIEKRDEMLERNDPIYTEPLTKVEEEEDGRAPLCKGSVDKWFLLWSIMLLCFGIVMCYSAGVVEAEVQYDNPTYYLVRNLIFSITAIAITIPFVIFARPWFWRYVGVGAYGASLFLLLLVLVIGTIGGGAQRWIAIGPITIQPSEIAKMGVVMMLALYMSKYEKEVTSIHKFGGNFKHGFFMPMMIIGLVCGLVALERHISGLMIIGMLGVCVMFLGGTRLKWLLMFFGVIFVLGMVILIKCNLRFIS